VNRTWPHQICLRALAGETTFEGRRPLPTKARAAQWLADMYGQDFGEDYEKWKAWLRYNWRKRVKAKNQTQRRTGRKLRPKSA